MKILKVQILIFLICVTQSSCVVDNLYNTGKKIWEFYSTLSKSNFTDSSNSGIIREFFGDDKGTNENIRDGMLEINALIRDIERSIDHETINELFKLVKSRNFMVRCLDLMNLFIESIDADYTKLYETLIRIDNVSNRSLDYLMKSVFPDIESNIGIVRKIMSSPHELLPNERSLLSAIVVYAVTQEQKMCDNQLIDEILVQIFKMAVIAEMKTHLMLIFANLPRSGESEEWKTLNSLAWSQFQEYFGTYVRIMRECLALTKTLYMRACDPKNGAWISDENYYEFNGLQRETIFRYQPTECKYSSCTTIWLKRSSRCDARFYDKRSGCSGKIASCQNFGLVQACVLESGPRKFQYVNSSIYGLFGRDSECPKAGGYMIDNVNGQHAGYSTCSCSCNGNHNKISLMITESPRDSNEVIIGLRLKRKNNILHIQPRVGELMADGFIQTHSERWLEIPNDIDESQIHTVNTENPIFFFDDVLLPPKFVLTGVRFKNETRETLKGFTIEIFGVRFNYSSGQLDHERRIQLSSSSANLKLRPLLFDRISPLRTNKHNRLTSPIRNFVRLQTSFMRNDFSQTMLPLFDGVSVTSDPPSALGGIGIFYKGVDGYAGFISLRVYGIRYEEYLDNFTTAHMKNGRVQIST